MTLLTPKWSLLTFDYSIVDSACSDQNDLLSFVRFVVLSYLVIDSYRKRKDRPAHLRRS